MKIVVLDGRVENPGDLSWDALARLGELTVYDYTAPADAARRMADAEAVITNKTVLTRELIEGAKKLRYIGILATGYNVVDIDAAREKGIPVCNVPSYATEAVAQFVFALLLELCHHVGHHNAQVQAGKWTACPDFSFWDYPLIELQGKTMGLIGYGRIGKALASRLHALHAHVTVSARKSADLAAIEAAGLRADMTGSYLHGLAQYDCVFNTAPAPVLRQEHLGALRADCRIIDLASGSGGLEADAPPRLHYIHALGLPGKEAPATAALLLRKFIVRTLSEQEAL